MAGADISAKLKAGLAKGTAATTSADALKVFKVNITDTSSAFSLGGTTETYTELKNAMFQTFDKMNIDSQLIEQGDRVMSCDNAVEINVNDVISLGDQEGGDRFRVIDNGVVSPSGYVIAYRLLLRSINAS